VTATQAREARLWFPGRMGPDDATHDDEGGRDAVDPAAVGRVRPTAPPRHRRTLRELFQVDPPGAAELPDDGRADRDDPT
jgi:hypothetical protein